MKIRRELISKLLALIVALASDLPQGEETKISKKL
jgi:hypothetical protein